MHVSNRQPGKRRMSLNILYLCTGNSCRSRMTEFRATRDEVRQRVQRLLQQLSGK
jgi:protein-tyrosine-phosphatase